MIVAASEGRAACPPLSDLQACNSQLGQLGVGVPVVKPKLQFAQKEVSATGDATAGRDAELMNLELVNAATGAGFGQNGIDEAQVFTGELGSATQEHNDRVAGVDNEVSFQRCRQIVLTTANRDFVGMRIQQPGLERVHHAPDTAGWQVAVEVDDDAIRVNLKPPDAGGPIGEPCSQQHLGDAHRLGVVARRFAFHDYNWLLQVAIGEDLALIDLEGGRAGLRANNGHC